MGQTGVNWVERGEGNGGGGGWLGCGLQEAVPGVGLGGGVQRVG